MCREDPANQACRYHICMQLNYERYARTELQSRVSKLRPHKDAVSSVIEPAADMTSNTLSTSAVSRVHVTGNFILGWAAERPMRPPLSVASPR